MGLSILTCARMWEISRNWKNSKTLTYSRGLLLSLIMLLTLSACVKMNDPEGSQEFNSHIVAQSGLDQSVGQSFISKRERFNGITLWLTYAPQQDGSAANGHLNIKLYHSVNDGQPISSVSIAISPAWQNSQVEIVFPPQVDVPEQGYYIEVDSTDSNIQFHGRMENAYDGGTTYLNREALDADLAFRMTYDYDSAAVLQDLARWSTQANLLIPLVLTLVVPGWVLLDFSGIKQRFNIGERTALAVGLSLAIIPLFMLWSTILHVRWNRNSLLGVLGFLIGFYLLRTIIRLKTQKFESNVITHYFANVRMKIHASVLTGAAMLIIIGGTFFIRLAMVRDLATPAWVDSVHHATITNLIMENGNFPASYKPYMEFDVHNYHIGFHSGVAIFSWLSNLEIPDALLIYGQALNALAALAVYLLTTTLTRKPLAGLLAAFITGFLTPMPAYYTSWGRYTQLAGLLILPTLITFLLNRLDSSNPSSNRRRFDPNILLATLAMSGLFLVHYRVIAFAVLFLTAEFIVSLLQHPKRAFETARDWALVGIACGFGAVILTVPWLYPTLLQIFIPKLAPPEATTAVLFGDFSWRFLTTAYGKYSLAVAALGLFWAAYKKPRLASVSIIWVSLLLFFSNLDALKLPGGGFITGTSVVIMLFIPISLLGGIFLSELISSWHSLLPQHSPIPRYIFWTIITSVAIIAASSGARQLLPIINPVTILSRQADRPALKWINENLPQEANFLINPFSWGFGLYAGNDGGYWITPVTGARSMPPPALYGLGNTDRVQEINVISQTAADPGATPLKIWELMQEHKIDYVYIGVRGGPLSTASLIESGLFVSIYQHDGVWILKVHPKQ